MNDEIKGPDDWRSKTLARVRALIRQADPEVVEEAFKALVRAAVARNTSAGLGAQRS